MSEMMNTRTLEAMRTQGRFSLFHDVAHCDMNDYSISASCEFVSYRDHVWGERKVTGARKFPSHAPCAVRISLHLRGEEEAPSRILLLHCHQRGHRLDPVPQILQANIFIGAVLVVVVIGDGNTDAWRLQIVSEDIKRDAAAERGHFDHGSASAFDRGYYRLRDR